MHTSQSARRLGLATAAVLLCTSALVPSAASAKPKARAASDANNISQAPAISKAAINAGRAKYGADATAQEALSAYWTPERMRNATPIEEAPFLKDATENFEALEADRKQQAETDGARGEPQPEPQGPELRVEPDTKSVIAGKKRPTTAAASAVNPNYSIYHPTAYTIGKVYFNMAGGSYVCSASIVNTEGRDTVWTAGHCVHGGAGGQWATNWAFVPAYDDDLANPRPWGTWTASFLTTRTAWINNSDFTEDMGVAIMNTNFGYHINDYFGGHGFAANLGKNVFVTAFGYPAEWPFDGGNLMSCSGVTSPEWTFLWITSETLKLPCDMTRGSSGGPWLYGYNGALGQLNGINSRIDRIVNPTFMYSPYFDNTAVDLYNFTRWF
jgi:V8-like Glu-specific endopeptidase